MPKRTSSVMMVLMLSLIFSGRVEAQERRLTIEECLALGLTRSKTLHASEMKAEYADAKAAEVAAALYPSLRFQAGYAKLSEVPEFRIPIPGSAVTFPVILDNYSSRLSLQQPLFTGGRLLGAAHQAEYSAGAARHDVSREKSDLTLNIKSAYWNLYRFQAFRRVADENVTVLAAHVADVDNLVKQGMLTNNDLLKVKVQLSNGVLMQSDAESRVRLAMITLNSLIGLPLATRVELASSLTATTKDFPEIDTLLNMALEGRPEVLGMEMRVRSAEAGVASARGGWLPQVFLMGNYYYSRPNQRIFPARDEFKDTWDVGVSLQFDLWNNLTTLHQTGAAKAQYEQTKDALATLKDGITLEVTQGALNVRQAQQRIRLAELGVEQAAESYRVTSGKFKSGLSSNSDLLDAEIALMQSKLQMTDALVEYELAQARLEKAVGEAK